MRVTMGADLNGHVGSGNNVLGTNKITEERRGSILVSIFKGKGDAQECSNYRGIKLMSHTLKILERIIDGRLREEVDIGKEQLGFMEGSGTFDGIFCLKGRGTSVEIFCLRPMIEYQDKKFVKPEAALERRMALRYKWDNIRDRHLARLSSTSW
ncbi:uncharacterized protein [Penaeus vannamei]|uniref:uncharacterized protein n=1 Tax=Penaeus vannamei TaxID=6689 RepID=UPI00387F4872